MPNELTVYDRVDNPMAYAERMGQAMARSGMFGANFNSEAGIVVAMTCLCERITPLQFIRTYHIIEGRPTMQADAMLAEFRNRGGTHKQIVSTSEEASIELTDTRGHSNNFTVTWEDAQQESWTQRVDKKTGEIHVKDNWQGPLSRQDMLWHTVCKRAVRRMAPEITAGIYTPEEAEEHPLLSASPVGPQTQRASPVEQPETVKQTAQAVEGVTSDAVDFNKRCSDLQAARIFQLFQQLEYPVDKIDAALAKRHVVKVSMLSPDQADEIIEKLDGQVAEKN